MKRVLKYKLGLCKMERLTSSNPTRLPPGAQIVSFEEADDAIGGFNIWTIVTDDAIDADEYESREIIVKPSGHDVADDLVYLATHHGKNRKVFHLFERKE